MHSRGRSGPEAAVRSQRVRVQRPAVNDATGFVPIPLSFLVFAMQLQCAHVAAKIHSLFHLPSPSPLQIRQYSYHDVIRVSEVEDVLDITNVQIYIINSARVLFLHEYLHERQRQPSSSSHYRSKQVGSKTPPL